MADAVHVLRRHGVDHVDIARQQRGHARRRVADDVELDVGEIVFGLVPPVGIVLQRGPPVGLAHAEDERAGSVGVTCREVLGGFRQIGRIDRVVRLAPGLAHDHPRGDFLEEDRIGDLHLEVDRKVVDLLDVLHRLEIAGKLTAGADRTLVAEHDVVGGERFASGELHPVTEVKTPGGRRRRLPRFGERGLNLEVAVAPYQRVVDVLREREQECLGPCVGVHRVGVAVVGPPECRGVDRRGESAGDASGYGPGEQGGGEAFAEQAD